MKFDKLIFFEKFADPCTLSVLGPKTVSVPTLILSTSMLLELMKFVKRELVVRLLKAKLLLTEPPPLPVNWKPLILLTTMLLELMKFVKSVLVVRLLKAKLLLTELPVNS